MNVFFELADCVADEEGKYFAAYGVRKSAVIAGKWREITWNSNRVWLEDEDGVRFLKNRYEEAATAKVDMKEFFWVKLRSVTV